MTTYHKEITEHHDGHGLTERIRVIAVDEPGPGGASHEYRFFHSGDVPWSELGKRVDMLEVGWLQFQKGPRSQPGSVPGVLTVAVLAALIDQARDFQAGPYPSDEGAQALYHLEEAARWLRERADKRAERGVLGINAK